MSCPTIWTADLSANTDFILALAHVEGPTGRSAELRLVVDTGSPVSIIRTDLALLVDLTAGPQSMPSRLRGPVGPHTGYAHPATLHVLGGHIEGLWLHCHDLDDDLKVDGVVGLDALKRGCLTVDFTRGKCRFDWASV